MKNFLRDTIDRRGALAGMLLCLCGLGVMAGAVQAAPPAKKASGEPKTVRLLTVGNSFSRNVTHYLEDITKAAGDVLILHQAYIGGSTMAQHLDKAELHAKDAKDPRGLYPTGLGLVEELQAEPWDIITIQQASIKSHDVSTYRPSARQIYDFIKQRAPKAEVVMHETWAYRCDDPRFAKKAGAEDKPGEPKTREEMYQSLRQAYDTIAGELGVRVIPVGDAFNLADSDPKWGYRPDTKFEVAKAKTPALPDQTHSLHVGWRWKNGKLGMDGHHAGMAGEYLGACVFYEFLFGKSVVGNSYVPEGLDPAYARFLQETAHRAVEARRAR